jgi:hypothetical protein
LWKEEDKTIGSALEFMKSESAAQRREPSTGSALPEEEESSHGP